MAKGSLSLVGRPQGADSQARLECCSWLGACEFVAMCDAFGFGCPVEVQTRFGWVRGEAWDH